MTDLPCVSKESQRTVVDELTRQIKDCLGEPMTEDQQEAATVFYGTLCQMMTEIFGYLPADEQSRILENCRSWMGVGMLLGKSPQKLVDILDKVNAEINNVRFPDWVSDRLDTES